MKKTVFVALCVVPILLLAGCSSHTITEPEFNFIWQSYLSKEFEESFDEKQSRAQKQKLLEETLTGFGLDYHDFVLYLKNKHPDKYKSLY